MKFVVANDLLSEMMPELSYDVAINLLTITTGIDRDAFDQVLTRIDFSLSDSEAVTKQWLAVAALLEIAPSSQSILAESVKQFMGSYAGDNLEDLKAAFANPVFGWLNMVFTFGTTGADIVQGAKGRDIMLGDTGDDQLTGREGDDALIGGAGDDVLYGGSGDDTLIGGTGTDRLDGSYGADTFILNRGDGHDTIANRDGSDIRNKLVLGPGIGKGDLSFGRLGHDLMIRIGSQGDQVSVEDYFRGGRADLEDIEIEGQTMSLSVLMNDYLVKMEGLSKGDDVLGGTNRNDAGAELGGDDTLHGYNGDDHLDGGTGDDSLYGGNDQDTLTGGEGHDALHSEDGDDSVTISNWYSNKHYRLDGIQARTSALLNNQVDQLVSAMASIKAPSGAGNVVPEDVKEELQPILADAWQIT